MDDNIYTWYTFATEIFKEVELNKNNFEDFNKPFLLVKEKISNLDDSSILFLYSKLKTDIKLEDYLKLTKKFNNQQLLTKFRTLYSQQHWAKILDQELI
jgi:Gpi18-like mannosyltransferase